MRRGVLAAMACVAGALALAGPAAADPLQIQFLSPDRYFSPNGDGAEDTFRATYGLTQAASVDVTITDDSGNIVRQVLHGAAQAPTWSNNFFEWNGLDGQGADVPDGAYDYAIRAETASGDVATAAGRIGVVHSIPGHMSAPLGGATLV